MMPNAPLKFWRTAMLTLSEVQQPFTNYVLCGESQKQILPYIKPNGFTPEQRLNVYRNNTQLGLTEALRDGYPVVNKLVGTEFFNQLARSYIRRYPPKAGCLLCYGGGFAEFIQDYQPANGLPYLPDVARLEWLWHEAFHEADAFALDMAKLATMAPEAYDKLGFVLHPSARFLASDFPILKIWQANQEGYESDGRINLDEGGCRLLVYRPQLEVVIIPLDETDYLFLTLLDRKQTLTQAVEHVLSLVPKFNVQTVLKHWIGNGLITDFFINN
jgi:hypothetical protein